MNKILKVTLILPGTMIVLSGLLVLGIFWGSALNASAATPLQTTPDPETPAWNCPYNSGENQGSAPCLRNPTGEDNPGGSGYGGCGRGGYGMGMMGGRYGGGMMGGWWGDNSAESKILSLEDAETAVQEFLDGLDNNDLVLHEIMIFENHAYAEIVEESTGIGAMEVLVDPVSLQVYPEHGPNMMWNLKYGMMSGTWGSGMMGGGMMSGRWGGGMMSGRWGSGMMGALRGMWSWGSQPQDADAEITVSSSEAVEIAQEYLDKQLPGYQVSDEADPFYGYYTLHILKDGEVTGMLSVNGFTGQVFPHTWHGEFIEMSEEH